MYYVTQIAAAALSVLMISSAAHAQTLYDKVDQANDARYERKDAHRNEVYQNKDARQDRRYERRDARQDRRYENHPERSALPSDIWRCPC